MKLVASMIVRNELGRYLELCVNHLLTYCDEVRVLDDGSDDGTYEWLEERNGVFVTRNTGAQFYEYESRARQELLNWTMESHPAFVLSIDADEFVAEPGVLKAAMRHQRPVLTLSMEEVWSVEPETLWMRVDGHWGPRVVPILWRAPQTLTYAWSIPDRKLACGREPMAVRQLRARPSGTKVLHFGWARQSEREERYQRYMTHDKGRFHRNTHLQSIMYPDEKVQLQGMLWPTGLIPISTALAVRTRS